MKITKYLAAVITGIAAGGTSLVALAPIAAADSISGYAPVSGFVSYSTQPGGYIAVTVTGDAPAAGPRDCFVQTMDNVAKQSRFRLDATGSGSTRIGPFPNGTYQMAGGCSTGSFTNPEILRVTLDGHPMSGILPTPAPSPGPNPLAGAPRAAGDLFPSYLTLLQYAPMKANDILLALLKSDFETARDQALAIERVAGPAVARAAAGSAARDIEELAQVAKYARGATVVGLALDAFDLVFNGPKAG